MSSEIGKRPYYDWNSMIISINLIKSVKILYPAVPKRARAIGGIWIGDSWAFERTLEADVRELFLDVFQEFGEEKKE